jgi:hypothetical protein
MIQQKIQDLTNTVIQGGLMKAQTNLTAEQAYKTAEEGSVVFKEYLMEKRRVETMEAGQVTNEDRQGVEAKRQAADQWFQKQKINLEYINLGKDVIMDAINLVPTKAFSRSIQTGNATATKTTTGKFN